MRCRLHHSSVRNKWSSSRISEGEKITGHTCSPNKLDQEEEEEENQRDEQKEDDHRQNWSRPASTSGEVKKRETNCQLTNLGGYLICMRRHDWQLIEKEEEKTFDWWERNAWCSFLGEKKEAMKSTVYQSLVSRSDGNVNLRCAQRRSEKISL